MKVYYIFSRNQKIGSKAIAWASSLLVKDLEKVPSHTAILVEIDGLKEQFIIESVMEQGVRIIPYSIFLERNELCYKIPCPRDFKTVDEIFEVVHDIWDKDYDKAGIVFFALCFLGHLLFKLPFPKENAWQSDDKYFCSEAVAKLSGYCKHSMTTPAKMCSDFLKNSAMA